MTVLRYLSSSVRSLAISLSDILDENNRSDISDLLLGTDETMIEWGEGNRIYFMPYTAGENVSGVDTLFIGTDSDGLAEILRTDHLANGTPMTVPGIKNNPTDDVPNEQAWKLSARVKYWNPIRPVYSYPGYEVERYFNVWYSVDPMGDFLTCYFEIDTNMVHGEATFIFGDGDTLTTTDTFIIHTYAVPGHVQVRITLDNGEVVIKDVRPGTDPNAMYIPPSGATVMEISATDPEPIDFPDATVMEISASEPAPLP